MATTLKAIEATVDPDGKIVTEIPWPFTRPTKVILTVAVEEDDSENHGDDVNLAVASEAAWGKDWERTEEDEAWASLQEETSS